MRIIDCSKESHLECAQLVSMENDSVYACVATEHHMDVFINEKPAMRITCTPEHLDELVMGRLLTEGLIRQAEDIMEIYICEKGLRAKVLVSKQAEGGLKEAQSVRVDTCCTDNKMMLTGKNTIAPVTPISWENAWVQSLAERMKNQEPLYSETHAVHACYLAMEDKLLCRREDIGRHNALDKVVGWAMEEKTNLSHCMLFTTGRMPADMVSKAIRAGIPLLASKTYPTDQGVALAKKANLTLVTVRPNGSMLVWNNGLDSHTEK